MQHSFLVPHRSTVADQTRPTPAKSDEHRKRSTLLALAGGVLSARLLFMLHLLRASAATELLTVMSVGCHFAIEDAGIRRNTPADALRRCDSCSSAGRADVDHPRLAIEFSVKPSRDALL